VLKHCSNPETLLHLRYVITLSHRSTSETPLYPEPWLYLELPLQPEAESSRRRAEVCVRSCGFMEWSRRAEKSNRVGQGTKSSNSLDSVGGPSAGKYGSDRLARRGQKNSSAKQMTFARSRCRDRSGNSDNSRVEDAEQNYHAGGKRQAEDATPSPPTYRCPQPGALPLRSAANLPATLA
jgi:hypothetical protein